METLFVFLNVQFVNLGGCYQAKNWLSPSAPGSRFDLGPRDSKQTLCEDNNNNNKHPITNPPGYKPIEMSSIYYDILKPNEKPVNAKHI